MCDERDSQLSNGWLRKVGVLGFRVGIGREYWLEG